MISVRRINGLGEVPATPATPQGLRAFEITALLGGGVLTATTLVLYGRGYNKEAAAIGATTALLGAVFASLKLASMP